MARVLATQRGRDDFTSGRDGNPPSSVISHPQQRRWRRMDASAFRKKNVKRIDDGQLSFRRRRNHVEGNRQSAVGLRPRKRDRAVPHVGREKGQ